MSRSACTNRSSIVLMSFEKKPMAVHPFFSWCKRRDQLRATAPSISNVRRSQGFPIVLRCPNAVLPTLELGKKRCERILLQSSARESARTLIILLRAIVEARVAQAGSDCQDPPVLHVLHERHLAQTLHHGVVVHERDRLVSADLGNGPTQVGGKVEAIALPIAGQVLCATGDRAVLFDHARTANADEGGQVQAFLFGASNELAQHLDQPFYRVVASGLVVDVAPLVEFPHRRLREIRRAFQIELDDAGAEIGAAEIAARMASWPFSTHDGTRWATPIKPAASGS